jgi:hypothetical protein
MRSRPAVEPTSYNNGARNGIESGKSPAVNDVEKASPSSGANSAGTSIGDLPTGKVGNPVQQQQGNVPDYTPGRIREVAADIENSNGVPRVDDKGNQKVFEGRHTSTR